MKCSAVKWLGCLGVALLIGMAATSARASDRLKVDGEAAEGFATVEMFRAIDRGDLEVTVIPKDATEATVLFTNRSKEPLAIGLPEAFVAIPVAPQIGGFAGPGIGIGGAAAGAGVGGSQGFGSGFGGPGLGLGGGGAFGGPGGGFGRFGGFMNVEPDTTRKVKVKGVCLDHGKKDPSPRIAYRIAPIDEYTDKPEVYEVCKMLARDEISQNVAQAAAWHLMDGLSWKQLSAKNRIESQLTNRREKWFSRRELQTAVSAVETAQDRAEALAKSVATRESSEPSQQQ